MLSVPLAVTYLHSIQPIPIYLHNQPYHAPPQTPIQGVTAQYACIPAHGLWRLRGHLQKGQPPSSPPGLCLTPFLIHLSSGFCSLRIRVNTGVIRNRGKAYVSDMIPRDTQNYSYEGGRPKGRSHSSHICSPGQTLLDNANLTLQGISLWCIISHQGKI